jgi:hypothetical protein
LDFKLKGGGEMVGNYLYLVAEWLETETARRAALTLENGTITFNNMRIKAGQSNDRRVSIDVDATSMTIRNDTICDKLLLDDDPGCGVVVIDIDPNKVLDVGAFTVIGPAEVSVTGTQTTPTPGRLESSASEGASELTCTCPNGSCL